MAIRGNRQENPPVLVFRLKPPGKPACACWDTSGLPLLEPRPARPWRWRVSRPWPRRIPLASRGAQGGRRFFIFYFVGGGARAPELDEIQVVAAKKSGMNFESNGFNPGFEAVQDFAQGSLPVFIFIFGFFFCCPACHQPTGESS